MQHPSARPTHIALLSHSPASKFKFRSSLPKDPSEGIHRPSQKPGALA